MNNILDTTTEINSTNLQMITSIYFINITEHLYVNQSVNYRYQEFQVLGFFYVI